MQVRIKTKPYKENSYCAHLVEHCVFSGYSNEENFFEIDCEGNGISRLGYTKFYIPNHKDIKKFIIHITKSLDTEIITKEKKVIKKEIIEDKGNTGDILVNKIGKKLYGKKFKRYPASFSITNQEVKKYHNKYYQRRNIRILDDDFNIIKRPPFNGHKSQSKPNYNSILPIYIKAEGKEFNAYIFNYTSVYEYTLCYFLEWLYNISTTYIYRYKGNSYYPPISHFFEFTDKLNFIRRKDIPIKITEKFFIKAKEAFLKNPINSNEISAVHEILKLEIISTQQIKKTISGLNYSFIKDFLEN